MRIRLTALLMLLAMMLCYPVTTRAEENPAEDEEEGLVFKAGEYYYLVNQDDPTTVSLTYERELKGYHDRVSIPEKVMYDNVTYRVTGIAFQAFAFCDITSIRIPESIEIIDDYAFYQCTKLTKVILPKSLRHIGYYAFAEMFQLGGITIPAGVETIGEQAFGGNPLIAEFKVDPENKVFKTVDGVLYDKDMTRLVAFPPASTIEQYTLPETIQELETGIFSGCGNLKEVILHDNVKQMYPAIFQGCYSLESVTLPGLLQAIPMNCFTKCSSLMSIEGATNVIIVGESAFANCTSLPNLNFLPMVQYIGQYAFSSCFGLKDLELPESVETVMDQAFLNCTQIRSVKIGSKLEFLRFGAFLFNLKLERFEVDPENLEFCDINGILFNKAATHLYCFPPMWSDSNSGAYDSYTLPDETEVIESGAFLKSRLSELTLNEGLEEIGSYAFQDCAQINKLILPLTLTKVGEGAFARCENLAELTVEATNPPTCDGLLCFDDTYAQCNLIVPEGSEELYWFAPYWTNFIHINGKEHIDVEESLADDMTESVWYTLQGIAVAHSRKNETPALPAGIYIKAEGNKTTKVLIRR